jgi:zinc transport system permease protein
MHDPVAGRETVDGGFDALLAPNRAPNTMEQAALPAHPPEPANASEHAAMVASPSLREFAGAWELYRDPMACGAVAGLALGVLGVFVVLRRAVFITAAISQSAALGVALAFYLVIHFGLAVPPHVSAFLLAAAAAASLALRAPRGRLPSEAVLGALYIGASALAVLVGDRIAQEAHDVSALLFGTAVLVDPLDLFLVLGASALVLAVLVSFRRGFVLIGFDPETARVHGLPVRFLDLTFWLMVALEASVATRALGALPVFAFAVLPGMAALLVSERLRTVLIIAALLGLLSGAAGYLAAFLYELPVGASQAAVAGLAFAVAFAASRFLGLRR